MSAITLATSDAEFEAVLRQSFAGSLNGELRRWFDELRLRDPEAAAREIAEGDPEVVAIGPGIPHDTMLRMAVELERVRPDVTVVMVATPEEDLWETALRAGIRDVIDPEAELTELEEAFERALETAARRRAAFSAERSDRTTSSRLVSVLSPKGGSGKTVVASNLAVGLAQRNPGSVALVDLDLSFGDVSNALMMVPNQTLADAVASLATLDATTLKVFLTPSGSDLYVLCAPDSPAQGEVITGEQVGRIIELLAQHFQFVVIDTPSGIGEHTLAAFDLSTDFVLVCDMDVSSVRALRKELELLDRLGITSPQRHLVLNRADSRVGLTTEDVVSTLGLDVRVAIPSSRQVPLSYNRGVPVLQADGRSPVGKAFSELVSVFSPEKGTGSNGSGWKWRS